MSVNDLISEQDEAAAHKHVFLLWPRKWREYVDNTGYSFNWEGRQFYESEIANIPNEPGLYSFSIQPQIGDHPACSYLMYIGSTKRTLRQRFREYLGEKRRESGRTKIVRMLNKYPDNIFFYFTVISDLTSIVQIEKTLTIALIPPSNDRLPVEVSSIVEALR